MALFPDISPGYEYQPLVTYNTLRLGPTDGDFIQRRRKRLSPLHSFKLQWRALTAAQESQLYDFYVARYGPWEAFQFFDFDAGKKWAVNVGTGTGAQTTWDLLGKDLTSVVIMVAGVTKTLSVDYNLGDGTGTDGQDTVIFIAGHLPAAEAAITATWTGKRYFANMIFEDDNLERTKFEYAIYRTGLTIREVSS